MSDRRMLAFLLAFGSVFPAAVFTSCHYPALPHHIEAVTVKQDKYYENALFHYKCAKGYHFKGSKENTPHKLQCTGKGWDPHSLIPCVDYCDNKCINGDCLKTLTSDGFGWKCDCHKDFVGDACDIKVCGSPGTIKNGYISVMSGGTKNGIYAVGSHIEFKCSSGYELFNGSIFTCGRNGWNKQILPSCEIACKASKIESGHISYIFDGQNHFKSGAFSTGAVLHFSCSPNYKIVGPGTVTCLMAGVWSHEWPHCKLQLCSKPPYIPHTYKESRLYHVGESVTYACLPGYMMRGPSTLVCKPDNQWSTEQPKCFSKVKPTETSMKHSTNNSSAKPLTIVTATAGGLLLLLLIVISLVAFQRRRIARIHLSHGRQRLNDNDDRYSIVYYSNDLHVVLPSYDEAMQSVLRPPPYADDENAENTAEENATDRNTEGASGEENQYETIDELLPTRNSLENDNGPTEPIYASIQRVLGTRRANSQEDSVDCSQAPVTESIQDVNNTTDSAYNADHDSVPDNNNEAEIENSVSIEDLSLDDGDDVPLISS